MSDQTTLQMDPTAPASAAALARCLLVANQKGGVGKSSTVAAIATELSRLGRRVLVVDGDQQGNVSRNDLGCEGDKGRVLAMALQYAQPILPVRGVRPGLDVIPGGPLLASVGAAAAVAGAAGMDLVENLRATLGALCVQERYDLVLIDSGPGDTPLLDTLLRVARYLVVPSCEDDASMQGVERLADRYLWARRKGSAIELLGVVLFNVNPRATTRNAQAMARISAMLDGSGSHAFEATIRTDKATAIDQRARHLSAAELVAESERHKKSRLRHLAAGTRIRREDTLWSRDPSALATDYQILTGEILTRLASHEQAAATAGSR